MLALDRNFHEATIDVRQIAGSRVTHVVLTHKHFDHVLGSGIFEAAEIYCAPEVFDYLTTATEQLRDDALHYGADAEEIDRAITALRPPEHATLNDVVDLGDLHVTIAHLGAGHTDADWGLSSHGVPARKHRKKGA